MAAPASISLEQALKQRVLMLNASTVNPAWSRLPDAEWGGAEFAQSPNLNLTRPDLVLEWSIELLKARADIIEAPSLGADAFTAAEYGVGQSRRREWTRAAVAIAREASAGQKFVIGAVGPSVDLLSYVARHSFEEHVEAFTEQIRDLWESHVDAIHLAYHLDSKMLQAALRGVAAVEDRLACQIPLVITFDLSPDGTIVSGERPEALLRMFQDRPPIALGLATYGYGGDTVRRLHDLTDIPVGLLLDPFPYAPPSMKGNRPIEWLDACLAPLLSERLLSFCGLSCTVPSIQYVTAIADLIQQFRADGHA